MSSLRSPPDSKGSLQKPQRKGTTYFNTGKCLRFLGKKRVGFTKFPFLSGVSSGALSSSCVLVFLICYLRPQKPLHMATVMAP